jgi:hypothetical protein
MYLYAADALTAVAGNLAACTPDGGMGCFPCCGVTSTTTAVQQSGSAGLGAAALILIGLVLWKMLTSGGR